MKAPLAHARKALHLTGRTAWKVTTGVGVALAALMGGVLISRRNREAIREMRRFIGAQPPEPPRPLPPELDGVDC